MQPYLHQLTCVLAAPLQVWSEHSGQCEGTGAQGIYCGDDRVLSRVELNVEGHEWNSLSTSVSGDTGTFRWLLRTPNEGADPVVSLTRHRSIEAETVTERIVIVSAARHLHSVNLRLSVHPDASGIHAIKAGAESGPASPDLATADHGVRWTWRDDATRAHFVSDGTLHLTEAGFDVVWNLTIEPGATSEANWSVKLTDTASPFVRPSAGTIRCQAPESPAVRALLKASTADLDALRLADRAEPDRSFLAAGAPWYFTLFGRDSLVAATMIARDNVDLALDTLSTLAARQGRTSRIDTAEQPGKILHEVRRITADLHDDATVLPPEYFGTIDATLLWVMLLGRVAEFGASDEQVLNLFDPLLAAMTWLRDHADADGDGFLEYFDESGHGLANQGWKDSGDAIRYADGTIAEGPIVLIEVQGYAYAAARTAARLLGRLGRTNAERSSAQEWDRYAAEMAVRIREQFWVSDELGPYLALALDGDKRPVTGVSSNPGHLLGLGLLTAHEEGLVVDRLMHETMFSGYGFRTMSTTNGAYWPLRYHVGSVWTHDTAWIVSGMLASGFTKEARRVADGLLRVAEGFGNRLPELFGGDSADDCYPPIPYPASCRPQAWSAASAFVVAEALAPPAHP